MNLLNIKWSTSLASWIHRLLNIATKRKNTFILCNIHEDLQPRVDTKVLNEEGGNLLVIH